MSARVETAAYGVGAGGEPGARLRQATARSGMSLRELARQLGRVAVVRVPAGERQVAALGGDAVLHGAAARRVHRRAVRTPTQRRRRRPTASRRRPPAAPIRAPPTARPPADGRDQPVRSRLAGRRVARTSSPRPGCRSPDRATARGWRWTPVSSGSSWPATPAPTSTSSRSSTRRINSTNDNRMLRHAGSEYGYLLEGELEVTVGFEVFTLRRGRALGLRLVGAAPVPQPDRRARARASGSSAPAR